MEQINWGFIGCGEVTEKKSGPAFNEVEGSRIVAVMSRSEQRARSYAERHGISRWYTDPQKLLDDPEVNAIYVATPPSSHATYAMMAMRSGKPVYVEKPLAASYDDCVRIIRVSEETGMPCFVAYYRRSLPYFKKVKSLIESGAIGKIVNVQIRYSAPPRPEDYQRDNLPWRVRQEIAGGGYFYDMASHHFDLLQDMFGVIVRAHGYHANRAGLYDVEDTVSASFIFENGIPGSGSWCFVGHDSASEDRIEIVGEGGVLLFSVFNYAPINLLTSEGNTTINVPNPPYVQLPLIKEIVEDLQGFGKCTCDCVSATPANWVLDRILGKI